MKSGYFNSSRILFTLAVAAVGLACWTWYVLAWDKGPGQAARDADENRVVATPVVTQPIPLRPLPRPKHRQDRLDWQPAKTSAIPRRRHVRRLPIEESNSLPAHAAPVSAAVSPTDESMLPRPPVGVNAPSRVVPSPSAAFTSTRPSTDDPSHGLVRAPVFRPAPGAAPTLDELASVGRRPIDGLATIRDSRKPFLPTMIPLDPAPGDPLQPVLHSVSGVGSCPCGCQPRCVTRSVWVPQFQTRFVNSVRTVYRTELRHRQVPGTRTVTQVVPMVERYTVRVPQPRIRKYSVNLQEEYQEQVQEQYTVMVPRPQQREISVDREEGYRVPVEEPYTVMVPQRRAYQETQYKTVVDRVPYQKKYVVQVPRQKTRIVTRYQRIPFVKTVRKPVVRMVTETRQRPKIKYRSEVRERTVTEEYFEYVTREQRVPVERFRNVPRERIQRETAIAYEEVQAQFDVFEYAQQSSTYDRKVPYTDVILGTETQAETYYVNEPYQETITRTYPFKEQVPVTVTRTYPVKIPVITYLPQRYNVRVPQEVTRTRYRHVTRQVPVTRYRSVTRDLGHWEQRVVTSCPSQVFNAGGCDCSLCCGVAATQIQQVWCPRIVTQQVPYTDYCDVPQAIPYPEPQLVTRNVIKTRQVPVTRYRTEIRTAELKSFETRDRTRTRTFEVTRYRWVARQRPITVKTVREVPKERTLPFIEYSDVTAKKTIDYLFRRPYKRDREYTETYFERDAYTDYETVSITEPVKRTRERTEKITVRVPYQVEETYEVRVPIKEFQDVEETEYIEVPKVETETYTEMVPEFRTRVEFRNVSRRVPVFVTRFRTEMVPQIRTRLLNRTETRTVTDKRMQTYMIAVPEVRTRTVFKTRYRDVPQSRTEVEWVQVPQTRYRTRLQCVTREVPCTRWETIKVNVPCQVTKQVPVTECRWSQRRVTVPLDRGCSRCEGRFVGLQQIGQAYLDYGCRAIGRCWSP